MAETVDTMLADLAFAEPVAVEDCKAVRDALKEVCPTSEIEVYCRTGRKGDQVVIRVDSITRRVTVS